MTCCPERYLRPRAVRFALLRTLHAVSSCLLRAGVAALLLAAGAHAQSAPSISNLSSNTGGVGQWIQIFGANFGSSQGSSTIAFNGVAATPIQWASGSIMTHVPTGATTGSVIVTVGGVASNGVTFTVITTPYIASINPASGGVGSSVSIYGSNFGSSQGSSTVAFNGVAATVSGWSNIQINADVPTGATTGNIVVTVGGVASNSISFTVYLNPTISSLSSSTGGTGQWVQIQGSNFESGQGSSTVTFNGTAATALQWTSGYINVDVPSGATTGSVVVTVAGVASNGVTFTIITAPYIVSINPTSGGVGSSVSIYGSNFGTSQGSSTVSFNGVTATVSGWGNNQINANVPTGATTGNLVVTVGGVASNAVSFTVYLNPTISSLSSTTGGVGQWTHIQGSNFGSSQGSSTVTFNGTAATALQWTSGYINVDVPSGASTGNVVVTVAGVASNGVAFTVITTPYIASFNPPYGPVGTSVGIYGSNFGSPQGSNTVTFNGVAASVSGWGNNQINANVPTGATTGNLVVTVGGVASNAIAFTVGQAPSFTSSNNATFATGIREPSRLRRAERPLPH